MAKLFRGRTIIVATETKYLGGGVNLEERKEPLGKIGELLWGHIEGS